MSTHSPAKSLSNEKMNLSFAGCGFLGLYHVGVASCFREYAPQLCLNRISGASAGALAAMALACQLPLHESTSELLRVAIKARSRALGPFHPSFDVNKIIYDGLMKTLPDDAHKRATGKLHISLTRVSDGQNVIMSKFETKDDLIKAVQCSCFIPFWSGIIPPKLHGIAYMDGGFSDNLPILDEHTITISPFSGESDICPKDEAFNIFQVNLSNTSFLLSTDNLYRLTRILFPAHPETLSQMCQRGFDDALRFLQRNNKIACTRCIAISITYAEAENEDEGIENDQDAHLTISNHNHTYDDCIDCQYRRQIAVLDSLPDGVVQAIQEACDQVNKGVINWLFRHRSMKLLSFLTIPYVLPIDITILLFCKIWERIPEIKEELKSSLFNLLTFLKSLVTKMESHRKAYSAKFSCQLAMTEIDYSHQHSDREVLVSTPNIQRKSTVSLSPNMSRKKSPRPSVEKANSFSGQRSLFNIKENEKNEVQRNKRKSYAGHDYLSPSSSCLLSPPPTDRRRSMVEMNGMNHPRLIGPPERTISKINFGYSSRKLDADDEPDSFGNSTNSTGEDIIDALKHIEGLDQANAVEIAKKALDWERECLEKYQGLGAGDSEVKDMLEVTQKKHKASIVYYYTDEDNRVKVTEIFTQPSDDNTKFHFDDEDGLMQEISEIVKPEKSQLSLPIPSSSSQSHTTMPSKRLRKKSVFLAD